MNILIDKVGPVTTLTINRARVCNAIDRPTAQALADALREFEADASARVAVLTGAGDSFCAGADLSAVADDALRANRLEREGDGPMGPSRMQLNKPLIAAIEGHAVAGGLADLRVVAQNTVLGVFCRRFGVPLIDGGTVRLPRVIGQGRALDLILTGRPVLADEALQIGLVNRVVPAGTALAAAQELALEIAGLPQRCMLSDRASSYEQWDLSFTQALENEFERGMSVINSGETQAGAKRFKSGHGRHGRSA
ncbi:crotonase/enoyl-CoA hydratase family protein [Pseudomonas sp. M30-35]|uniref:crotonase/enoyl-CoA hydratase family protein n=1 Tax=Pseudomonas sp. M30-35 TaxID=1981174 RepID=UPI000B3CF8C2|nr:crotonase/enoyl-CoA hydratase family protein [Pseudomonas sp. M30-35]ARU89563.1 enoyl-CoA hydratase [Pseudomonas sp. M30-35]